MISSPSERAGEALSLKEAAVVSGVSERVIRHELADKVIRPVRRTHRRVFVSFSAVRYCALTARVPFPLPRSDRRDLFEIIEQRSAAHGNWRSDGKSFVRSGEVPLRIQTDWLDKEVSRRLKLFTHGMKKLETRAEVLGGEPVFKGTRISVRHVGELVRKGTRDEELREDFPRLDEGDFEFARMFVELGRGPGRPRKLKLVRE